MNKTLVTCHNYSKWNSLISEQGKSFIVKKLMATSFKALEQLKNF